MHLLIDVFALNANDHPELKELILFIQQWDRRANVENVGAAQWSVYYKTLVKKADKYDLYGKGKLEDSIIIEALMDTKTYLLEHFDRLNITLSEQQVHARGEKEIPVPGLVDMIAAMSTAPYEDGKVKAVSGESYIMLARYSANGVELETILPYGQSCNINSPYFTDQMECYVSQSLKPMVLDKQTNYENALKIYHPRGKKQHF